MFESLQHRNFLFSPVDEGRNNNGKPKEGDLSRNNEKLTGSDKKLPESKDELKAANKDLIAANKDLTAANQDLTAANKNLIAANKNLAKANDDYRISNQDLKTVNRDLRKSNHDLTGSNEGLRMSNQDLDETRRGFTSGNQDLQRLNYELREARRSALNLLEDAHLTEAQLATDLANMRLLVAVSEKLVSETDVQESLLHVLNAAITITKASAGTIQIFNKKTQQLQIVASKGFSQNFVNHFEFVDVTSNTSCGLALRKNERVFVDYNLSPEHDPDGSLRMHVKEGFLSAQSTPLLGRSKAVIGMFTTHFKKNHRPHPRELYFIDLLARQAADMVERVAAEDALRRSEEQLRQFNESLEQQVSERTKELEESHVQVTELNSSLVAMNRELNSLNSELRTFTNIAAGTYRETLRHLYINLEMIVTQDARNLSNSSRANLRRAQAAVQRMKLLTEDLISFSTLHETNVKEQNVDLDKILQVAVTDFTSKPNHPDVEINCGQLPLVSGYRSLLPLLFHHLLDNAVKFRKGDTHHVIDISCREVNGEDLVIEGADKNLRYHIISFADNGIGFSGEESEKIFEMFYQVHEKGKYRGSGTGLALCKKIMEMHGGFITAKGQPGEGAVFECYFPILS